MQINFQRKSSRKVIMQSNWKLLGVTAWPSHGCWDKYDVSLHQARRVPVLTTLLPAEHPSISQSIYIQSAKLSASHTATFLMIKEVIRRLKLHLSLNVHKLSINTSSTSLDKTQQAL